MLSRTSISRVPISTRLDDGPPPEPVPQVWVQHTQLYRIPQLTTAVLASSGLIWSGFTPDPPPPEETTMDKWFRSLSEPLPRRPTAAQQFEARTWMEDVTPAKWWQPLAVGVRAPYRPQVTWPFPAPPLIIVPGADSWHRPLNLQVPPKQKPRGDADVRPIQVTVPSPDGWYNPLNLQVLAKQQPRGDSFVRPIQITVPAPDTWYGPLGQPLIPKPRDRGDSFVRSIQITVPGPDSWFGPLNQPLISRPRDHGDSFTRPIQITVPGPDSWYGPLNQPVLAKQQPRGDAFVRPLQIVVPSPDGWYAPLNQQVQSKWQRPVEFSFTPYVVATPDPEVITVDKWYSPLNQPLPPKRPRQAESFAWPPYIVEAPVETITMDKWYRELNAPVRYRLPLQHQVITPSAVPTLSSTWFQPWASQRRAIRGQGSAIIQTPAILDDMRWFQPLALPLRRAVLNATRELIAPYYPLVPSPDRWWQQLSVPVKVIRSGRRDLIVVPYDEVNPSAWLQALSTPQATSRRQQQQGFIWVRVDEVTAADWMQPLSVGRPAQPVQQQFAVWAPWPIFIEPGGITMDTWYRQLDQLPTYFRIDRTVYQAFIGTMWPLPTARPRVITTVDAEGRRTRVWRVIGRIARVRDEGNNIKKIKE